jgi:hypothetical protein
MTSQRSEAPSMSDWPAYCVCMTSCLWPRRLSVCPYCYLSRASRPLLQQAPGDENVLRRRGITPRILSLSNRQSEWSANTSAECSLDRRCGVLHSRSGRYGEEKNLCPSQESSNNSPFVQPAAYSLYWLSYSGSILGGGNERDVASRKY